MMIFFVAEGYHHTHDFRRYLRRLLMLAVVSHFAFCYFNMSGFNPLGNLLFNATSIAWPLLWGLILLKVWDMERLARWQKVGVTRPHGGNRPAGPLLPITMRSATSIVNNVHDVAKIKSRKFPAVEIRRKFIGIFRSNKEKGGNLSLPVT